MVLLIERWSSGRSRSFRGIDGTDASMHLRVFSSLLVLGPFSSFAPVTFSTSPHPSFRDRSGATGVVVVSRQGWRPARGSCPVVLGHRSRWHRWYFGRAPPRSPAAGSSFDDVAVDRCSGGVGMRATPLSGGRLRSWSRFPQCRACGASPVGPWGVRRSSFLCSRLRSVCRARVRVVLRTCGALRCEAGLLARRRRSVRRFGA